MIVGKETRRVGEGVEAGEEERRTGGEGVEVVGGQEQGEVDQEVEVECAPKVVMMVTWRWEEKEVMASTDSEHSLQHAFHSVKGLVLHQHSIWRQQEPSW